MPRSHRSSKVSHQHKVTWLNQAWIWIVLGVGVIIIGAFVVFTLAPNPSIEISAAQAYEKYQQGAFFVDVRTQSEWDQMHLAKSTLIPLDQLASRLDEVPKDKDVVVLCRSGVRAKTGVTILRNAGYSRAVCMTGGLLAWQAAGYPLEMGSQ